MTPGKLEGVPGGLGDLTHERENGTKAGAADGHLFSRRLKTMTGTDLEIIPPERAEIAGADAERMPSLNTTAKKDGELVDGL